MSAKFKTAYGKRERVQTTCTGGKTKSEFYDQCDINQIMAKYQKTGLIDHANTHAGNYGVASSQDFETALNTVTEAQQMFDDLPSSIRHRFENNPAAFLDFVQDETNLPEMQEMGLVPKTVAQTAPESTNAPSVDTEPTAAPEAS